MQTKNAVGSGIQHRLHKRSAVMQGLLSGIFFSHIAKHQHRANHLPIKVAYWGTAVGNIALTAIACNQHGVVCYALHCAMRQGI